MHAVIAIYYASGKPIASLVSHRPYMLLALVINYATKLRKT